jgi:hypothetical protein
MYHLIIDYRPSGVQCMIGIFDINRLAAIGDAPDLAETPYVRACYLDTPHNGPGSPRTALPALADGLDGAHQRSKAGVHSQPDRQNAYATR